MLEQEKPKRKNDEKPKPGEFHWTYERDEWVEFAKSEWKTGHPNYKHYLLLWVVVTFLGASQISGWAAGLVAWIGFTTFIFGIVSSVMFLLRYSTYKSRLTCQKPEVYISPEKIIRIPDGKIVFGNLYRLNRVSITNKNHPLLEFRFGEAGKSEKEMASIYILIPRGGEKDARKIVTYFQSRIMGLKGN